MSNAIQQYCKSFRMNVLNLTLREVEMKTNVKPSALSAFENGYSNSMLHLKTYTQLCNSVQLYDFKKGLKNNTDELIDSYTKG